MVVAYDPRRARSSGAPTARRAIRFRARSPDTAWCPHGGSQAKRAMAIKPGGEATSRLSGNRLALRQGHGLRAVTNSGRPLPLPDDRQRHHDLPRGGNRKVVYEGGRPPVPATFTASLVSFGDRLLATSEDGDTFVIRTGPTHEVLRTNSVGEPVYASLALAGGTIYIRGAQHLFAVEQADELAEHHGGRAPHLVPEEVEVGILDRDAFANPGPAGFARRRGDRRQRHLQDLLDLVRRRAEVRPPVGHADDRMQREAADEHVHRRELAQHPHVRRIDADFFGGLAKRRLARAFRRARSRRPAG